jgi:hypothetical protein
MTSLTKKNNDTKELSTSTVDDAVASILADPKSNKKQKKVDKFCLYLAFGYPVEVCAKLSGCSMSWAYKLHAKYAKDTKMLAERIAEITGQSKDRFHQVSLLRLPQIAQIHGKALKEMEDDPKLAIEKPQLLRQVMNAAGVLDEVLVTPSIQINLAILQQSQEQLLESVTDIDVPADVITIEEGKKE